MEMTLGSSALPLRIICSILPTPTPSTATEPYSPAPSFSTRFTPSMQTLEDQQTYTRFLTLLKMTMNEYNLPLQPTTVFVDFEAAAHNAIHQVFPGVTVKGCFFHFTRCIWRKAQQTGLQQLYRHNDDVNRLVRLAAVLPLVPLDKVEDVWFNALEELDDADLPVDTLPFTDYVVSQWMEGDRQTWNHYATKGHRTTNNLEAWHGKLKKKVRHSHPNIYTIIRVFQEIQASIEIDRIQKDAGGPTRPRCKKYRNIDRRLTQLKERLENNTLSLMEYADAASHLLHLE
ncbi:uncharacterized protein LOC117314710 [Pecten maximus]|uniref:uncharacterized protein LOC117314710 n=1 Tax=Pecten maximus TaxID=6579 RepID=UPI001458093E|nr:uncharacterized protein LOC117314710 [Pecten maximus]